MDTLARFWQPSSLKGAAQRLMCSASREELAESRDELVDAVTAALDPALQLAQAFLQAEGTVDMLGAASQHGACWGVSHDSGTAWFQLSGLKGQHWVPSSKVAGWCVCCRG